MLLTPLVIVLAYLVGAIPFGLVIGRLFKGVDIREYGSGKTGATNVMRTAGLAPGVLALLGDLGKGAAAVFLARAILPGNHSVAAAAALAAIAGHNWPVYVRFRGGRGVTTYFGGLLALAWWVGVIGGGITLLTVALTRYMSLGSLLGAAVSVAVAAYLASRGSLPLDYLIYSAAGTVMLGALHQDNIRRLVTGKERKVGEQVELAKSTPKDSRYG